jgi:hypothetical protein
MGMCDLLIGTHAGTPALFVVNDFIQVWMRLQGGREREFVVIFTVCFNFRIDRFLYRIPDAERKSCQVRSEATWLKHRCV